MTITSTEAGSIPETLFQARWVTGWYHHRPWFSANRCLSVLLTSEALHTRLMFPFSLLSSDHWGFKNSVPLVQIKSAREARFLNWWPTVEITYLDGAGQSRCLEIGFTGPLPQIGSGQLNKRAAFILALEKARGL